MKARRGFGSWAVRFVMGGSLVLTAGVPASAAADVVEYGCGIFYKASDGSMGHFETWPDLQVLEITRKPGPFTYNKKELRRAAAISCVRSSVVPQVLDFEVVDAGFPLFLRTKNDNQVVVLEAAGGRYQIRVMRGVLSADEQQQASDALDAAMDARGGSH